VACFASAAGLAAAAGFAAVAAFGRAAGLAAVAAFAAASGVGSGAGFARRTATAAPHVVQNRSPDSTACPLGHFRYAPGVDVAMRRLYRRRAICHGNGGFVRSMIARSPRENAENGARL
jgi:hypothetical protein